MLLCLVVLIAGLGVFTVLAQEDVSFSSLEIDLWPEYDSPDVLVIYRIRLDAGASLPADLTLRIPADAQVNAVAARQADGSLFNIAYERIVSGDWAEISFNAALPDVQVEYYDPNLVKEGSTRTYQYRWPGDYAVEALAMEVQQPAGAANLTTSPAMGAGTPGQDGMMYYRSSVGALPAGQKFDLSLSYEKTTDDFSAAGLQVQPSAPVDDMTASWLTQFLAVMPWGLLTLGVLLLAGGGIWYWQSGKRKSRSSQPQRRRHKPAQPAGTAPEGQIYCHACGKRAAGGDRFCRACGTRLRLE
jgi:hypothetical protein